MRSAKSMKSFSFSAVASPTYDDHLDTSFDDYSNYVDEVSFRSCKDRIVILIFPLLQHDRFQFIVFVLGRRKL